jgi:hypothetical protein
MGVGQGMAGWNAGLVSPRGVGAGNTGGAVVTGGGGTYLGTFGAVPAQAMGPGYSVSKDTTYYSGQPFNKYNVSYVGTPQEQWQMQVLPQLMSEYQRAYNEARQANEERYKQLLTGYQSRYDDAMNYLGMMSNQSEKDIRSQYQSAANQGAQDLMSRGLSGSTIAPTMRQGYMRQMDAELQRNRDAQIQQRLGYQTALSKDRLDVIERREDTYPSWDQLAQLALGVGKAGG